ncbi:homoserine dehydrogenase [Evansella caseinilytica]|uniref:Homoserine dehydrogenase n=1 Tax=Evansella caseinilytica TaxID=1503961 RepID=A0A1H3UPG2_9BACI|nr:homoserine dehydrogenase [Evansella caseinilytica]SDZ64313.1 homoserine dehydrogenase [Evansella caseinilytica]
MAQRYNIALIGFGTVGEGVYRTIENKRAKLEALIGRQINIPFVLVKNTRRQRHVSRETVVTSSLEDILNSEMKLDLAVEAVSDAESAYPYVDRLLKLGVPVVSANKELIAKRGPELQRIAAANKCRLLYEAAVAGGIPLLNTLRHALKVNTIVKLEGILNGTSNFMLTKMREDRLTFAEALQEAQEKGYAEAVPDKDVDGWDAYFKTTILSQWLYGKSPRWEAPEPVGIRAVGGEDMELGEQLCGRIKHIASLVKEGETIRASVRPSFVFHGHPLFGVEGVNNGVHIEGSIVGSLLLQGPGAGKYPTSSAVVEDIVSVLTNPWEQEKDGSEFIAHGFPEKQDSDQRGDDGSSLWFVTGKHGLLQSLAQAGAELLQSAVHPKQKTAAIVEAVEEKVELLKLLSKGTVEVYPVLADRQTVIGARHSVAL